MSVNLELPCAQSSVPLKFQSITSIVPPDPATQMLSFSGLPTSVSLHLGSGANCVASSDWHFCHRKQEFVFKRCKVDQLGKCSIFYMVTHKGVGGTSPYSALCPLRNLKGNLIKSPPLQMTPATLPGTVNMDDVEEIV